MKKLSILLAAVILAITALIAGCGSSVADEFVGTWASEKDSNGFFITIEKTGDKTFTMNHYFFFDNNVNSNNKYFGELKENSLLINNGFYNLKDSKLIDEHNSYFKKIDKKVFSKEEIFQLHEKTK